MEIASRFGWASWLGVAALVPVAGVALHLASCVNDSTADPTCPNYCTEIMKQCTGDDQQYPDEATCERICGQMTPGTQGQGGVDTVACRMLNVSSAKDALSAAEKHGDCVAGGVSASSCGKDPCEEFCNTDLKLCGTNAPYASVAECQTACAAWGQAFNGPLLNSTGDTLQCRTYHLELSQTGQVADLATHCPHTGATSARCNNATGDGGTGDGGSDAAASDATTD